MKCNTKFSEDALVFGPFNEVNSKFNMLIDAIPTHGATNLWRSMIARDATTAKGPLLQRLRRTIGMAMHRANANSLIRVSNQKKKKKVSHVNFGTLKIAIFGTSLKAQPAGAVCSRRRFVRNALLPLLRPPARTGIQGPSRKLFRALD